MAFADEVAAHAGGIGTTPKMVTALNALPAAQRRDIVAYLDALPHGVTKAQVARAINARLDKAGVALRVSPDNVGTFIDGSRHGLL